MFLVTGTTSYSASSYSWLRKDSSTYKTLYGGEASDSPDFELSEDEEEYVVVEDQFSKLFKNLGDQCYHMMTQGKFNITIDGIIYGRIAQGAGISYMRFDLSAGNPWGIVGASLYVFFRKVFLGLILIVTGMLLCPNLFKFGTKERIETKQLLKNILFSFFIIYTLPPLIEVILYFFDVILYLGIKWMDELAELVGDGNEVYTMKEYLVELLWSYEQKYRNMGFMYKYYSHVENTGLWHSAGDTAYFATKEGLSFLSESRLWQYCSDIENGRFINIMIDGVEESVPFHEMGLYTQALDYQNAINMGGEDAGIISTLRKIYVMSDGKLLNAIMYAAAVFAGFFFFVEYTAIALLLTALFGFFPLIALISLFKKQSLLGKWCEFFFPNLMVPMIDGILFLIPTIVYAVFSQHIDRGNIVDLGVVSFIELFCIWSIVPTRNYLLRLFGLSAGSGMLAKNGALGGMLMGGLMLMRTLGGRRRSIRETGSDNAMDSISELEQKETESRVLGNIMKDAQKGVDSSVPQLSGTFSVPDTHKSASGESEVEAFLRAEDTGSTSIDGVSGDGIDSLEQNGDFIAGDGQGVGLLDYTADTMADIGQDSYDIGLSSLSQNYDSEFSQTLTDEENARYNNLVLRDSIREKIAANNAQISALGYNENSYAADREVALREIAHWDKQIASYSTGSHGSKDVAYQRMVEAKGNSVERLNSLDRGYQLSQENAFYASHERRCDQKELMYARNNVLGDMDNGSYQNASLYRSQLLANQARREFVSYKNFDSRQYSGILTPDERAEYYRERRKEAVRRDTLRRAGAVAGAGAAVIVGGTTAVAMTYGGPRAMSTGAMLGGVAGNYVGSHTTPYIAKMGEGVAHAGVSAAVGTGKMVVKGTEKAVGAGKAIVRKSDAFVKKHNASGSSPTRNQAALAKSFERKNR